MLSKRSQNHRKKSIWIIAGTGIVLAVILICASVFYIGRNPSEQTSHVTIMFGRVPKEPLRLNESFDQGTGSSGLPGVSFELAEGYDNPDEKGVIQAVTGADGTADFDVPEGEYTLRWQKAGYYGGYQNVKVQGETVVLRKWLIRGWLNPDSSEEEPWAYILLEWESEENLDLCVYQEKNGRCIGIEPTMDAEGSFLYDDNNGAQGYELVFLKNAMIGNYRIYVKDCDSILNDCGSRMEAAGVSVSIYTAQGIVYQKKAETEETAGLWECAGLCSGEVIERDQYLYDLTGYAWALRDGEHPASWTEGACIKAEEVYEYTDDGLELDSIERMEFDAEGNMLLDRFYHADGSPDYQYEYEYDENGNTIAQYVFYYKRFDPTGRWSRPILVMEREYNEAGECIRDGYYDIDGQIRSQSEHGYEYDASGNLVKKWYLLTGRNGFREGYQYECEYDEEGRLIVSYYESTRDSERREYEYDEDGKETVCYVYRPYYGGAEVSYILRSRCESEYDGNGNLKVYSEFYVGAQRDVLGSVTQYEYDTDGNCIAIDRCNYTSDGELEERTRYEYHASGRLIMSARGEGEFWDSQLEFEYDDMGNETAMYSYRYDGGEISSVRIDQYEYDEMGNVTAYWHCSSDGVWRQMRAARYVYDARAGMKIAYYYEEQCLVKKIITTYDFGESTADN